MEKTFGLRFTPKAAHLQPVFIVFSGTVINKTTTLDASLFGKYLR